MKNKLVFLFSVALFIAAPLVKAQTPANLPDTGIFKNPANFKKYEGKLKECVAWDIKTPCADKDVTLWEQVDNFIWVWISGSPDVTVSIGDVIEPLLKDKKDKGGFELLLAYMGGIAVYELNKPTDKDEANIEYAGLKAVLEMVNNNGDLFANAKAVKKYRSMDDDALRKYVKDCLAKQNK